MLLTTLYGAGSVASLNTPQYCVTLQGSFQLYPISVNDETLVNLQGDFRPDFIWPKRQSDPGSLKEAQHGCMTQLWLSTHVRCYFNSDLENVGSIGRGVMFHSMQDAAHL